MRRAASRPCLQPVASYIGSSRAAARRSFRLSHRLNGPSPSPSVASSPAPIPFSPSSLPASSPSLGSPGSALDGSAAVAIDRSVDPAHVPIPNPGSREAKAAFKAASASVSGYKLTPADVRAAYRRISPIVSKSPLDFSPRLSSACDCQVYLKKEHVSIVGSYKERGALNKLLQLSEAERRQGVICSSAGNHAQAVAYHSTRLGIDGVIVMPRNAPHVKVQRVRDFGAKVVQAGESFAEAYEAAVALAKDEGRTFIHAFNDNDVIAGQGVSPRQATQRTAQRQPAAAQTT